MLETRFGYISVALSPTLYSPAICSRSLLRLLNATPYWRECPAPHLSPQPIAVGTCSRLALRLLNVTPRWWESAIPGLPPQPSNISQLPASAAVTARCHTVLVRGRHGSPAFLAAERHHMPAIATAAAQYHTMLGRVCRTLLISAAFGCPPSLHNRLCACSAPYCVGESLLRHT